MSRDNGNGLWNFTEWSVRFGGGTAIERNVSFRFMLILRTYHDRFCFRFSVVGFVFSSLPNAGQSHTTSKQNAEKWIASVMKSIASAALMARVIASAYQLGH
ncbi:hypothetical protein [Novacetimonas cocois]|uniref:hypothetical protein n=1 Tax=Novacetimonas cocois TaxID=1747507 RepID=UPI001403C7D3|nr:hypothetical protein [Novacetimonas cocois]